MYWPVLAFEIICWVAFAALALTFLTLSVRERRVHIGLWMVIGVFSMSWLEAPFDNSMYAVFHPDFHRLPDWGPIGATQGQLPLIAPPGYVLYFVGPALIAIGVARWGQRRFGWRPPVALLTCGLVVGIVWDAAIEMGQANTVHLWSFARGPAGPAITSGEQGFVPFSVPLAMASFIAPLTYVLGRKADDGRPMLLALVSGITTPGRGRTFAMLVSSVAFANVFYALSYVPHVLTKESGWLTQAGKLTPYPGQITTQPGATDPQSNGTLGAVIIWGGLIALLVIIALIVRAVEKRLSVAPAHDVTAAEPELAKV